MRADVVYAVLGIVSSVVILVCAFEAIISNKTFAIKGLFSYIALLLSFAAGNVFFVMQCLAQDVDFAFLSFKLQYVITLFTMFLYIAFFRTNLKRGKLKKRVFAAVGVYALAYLLLLFFNFFDLFFVGYEFSEVYPEVFQLKIAYAPLFFVFQALLYLVFIFWVIRVIAETVKGKVKKRQGAHMVLSVVPLIIANILYIAQITKFDTTNILFGVSAVLLTACLTRYGIMNTTQYLKNNFFMMFADPFFVVLTDGALDYANKKAEDILGISLNEMKGESISLINPEFSDIEKLDNMEIVCSNIVYKLSSTPLISKKNTVSANIIILKDVTEQKLATQKIEYLSNFDNITGLVNPEKFIERIEKYVRESDVPPDSCCFLAVSADNSSFSQGIVSNDEKNNLYRQIVDYFRKFLGANYEMSRFSENEFCIFLKSSTLKKVLGVFEQYRKKEFEVFGAIFNVEFKMGIYFAEKDVSVDDGVEKALFALKTAQINGIAYKTYDFNLSQQHELKKNLIACLPLIDYKKDFYLEFQPIVDIKRSRVAGAEALLRWSHPIYGNLSPAVFIPIFEAANEMDKLGNAILEKACDALKSMLECIEGDFKLSINISKKQMDSHSLFSEIKNIILQKRVEPKYFDFEITETAAAKNREDIRQFSKRIKEFGASVSMDDFGSGDTSIAYITDFGVDKIKLDISISDNAHVDTQRGIIVKSLLSMCTDLSIDVVVEHVESIDALTSLAKQGFSYIQGYIFSRSLPLSAFKQFYTDFNQSSADKEFKVENKQKVKK